VVDDVGTGINPMLVKGQIMGGIAQGLGQVLIEDKSYDETGQVVTGSFMTTPCRGRTTSALW
jgi:aerobic carbon-monoxide dehydrogenase large subunit